MGETWGVVKLVCTSKRYPGASLAPRDCAHSIATFCRFSLEIPCRPVCFPLHVRIPPPGKWKQFYGNFSLMQRGRQLRSGQRTAHRTNGTARPRSSRALPLSLSLFEETGRSLPTLNDAYAPCCSLSCIQRAMDRNESCVMNVCCAEHSRTGVAKTAKKRVFGM